MPRPRPLSSICDRRWAFPVEQMGMSRWGGEGGDRFLVLVVVARGKGMAKISPSISEGKGAHRRGEVDQLVDDTPCRLCPVYGLDGPRRLHGWGPRVVTCRCPLSNCPSVGLSVCPLSVCRLSSSPSPPHHPMAWFRQLVTSMAWFQQPLKMSNKI